jgi:hypothetical protein
MPKGWLDGNRDELGLGLPPVQGMPKAREVLERIEMV